MLRVDTVVALDGTIKQRRRLPLPDGSLLTCDIERDLRRTVVMRSRPGLDNVVEMHDAAAAAGCVLFGSYLVFLGERRGIHILGRIVVD